MKVINPNAYNYASNHIIDTYLYNADEEIKTVMMYTLAEFLSYYLKFAERDKVKSALAFDLALKSLFRYGSLSNVDDISVKLVEDTTEEFLDHYIKALSPLTA